MLRGSLLIASKPPYSGLRFRANQQPSPPARADQLRDITDQHISNLFPLLTASDKVLNLKKNGKRCLEATLIDRSDGENVGKSDSAFDLQFPRQVFVWQRIWYGAVDLRGQLARDQTPVFAVGACRVATMVC
ncbi:hypothetical protein KC349_g303 [Hortaea werneckii]|nr:hypothetical protein KC349_g303 [Hortaea werneckii]